MALNDQQEVQVDFFTQDMLNVPWANTRNYKDQYIKRSISQKSISSYNKVLFRTVSLRNPDVQETALVQYLPLTTLVDNEQKVMNY